MDPVSDQNRQENESTNNAGLNRSDIDPHLEQGAEDVKASESATDGPPPDSAAACRQADVDALFDGSEARTPENVATGAGAGPVMGAEGVVSQSDIDALTSSAQGVPQAAEDQPTAQPEQAPHEQACLSDSDVDALPLELSDLSVTELRVDTKRVTMLNDVNLRVKLQLGKTKMLVEDILNLGEGSVVELDKLAGDPIDVLVNDRLIARGEVLVLNDNFCVRISEVLTHDPHRITT